jgi:flavin reductase (DIM6/NTAB) family NADH-FMN oxidoreductase RutF
MKTVIQPKMLYLGTPVVLISTLNEDGTPNIAPMSSAWWLRQSCMLGLGKSSKTAENLLRERECVLNLPSADLVDVVDRLAMLTGRDPVPTYKLQMGYRFEPDKFGVAGLNTETSDLVKAPRIGECPIQLEARIVRVHEFGEAESLHVAFEASILRVHMEDDLLMDGTSNYIDSERWRPLIMSFCEFYGLGQKLGQSKLARAWAPAGKTKKIPASRF